MLLAGLLVNLGAIIQSVSYESVLVRIGFLWGNSNLTQQPAPHVLITQPCITMLPIVAETISPLLISDSAIIHHLQVLRTPNVHLASCQIPAVDHQSGDDPMPLTTHARVQVRACRMVGGPIKGRTQKETQ